MYNPLKIMLLGIIMCASLQAQSQNNPKNSFVLNTVYNRYWQSDTTTYLEIETAFYPNRMTLTKDSAGYHGSTELRILVQRKSDSVYVKAERFVVPVNIHDTSASALSQSIINKLTYMLGIGTYNVAVYGIDGMAPVRRDSAIFNVEVSSRPSATTLSDVELCSNITESTDTKDLFYKNTYRAIPNPGLVFGSTAYPVVFSYVELYNLQPGQVYLLNSQIVDAKGTVVKQKARTRQFSVSNTVDVGTLNVATIISGKYKYQFLLSDTLGHEIARAEKPLFLYNPHVQAVVANASSIRISEFAGMSSDELVQEFRQAQYIARSEDKSTFAQMHTAGEQSAFLAQFWTDVESGKRDVMDMTRAIYLQRVETANQRYRSMGQEGWHTDRGRVYVLYGESDEVERFPSTSESKPYEIWHYNQIEGSVIFVFIDRTGFGEYTLVNSTKRGEVKDDNWQNYLQ
jgi:GWxTD domain-containing protein